MKAVDEIPYSMVSPDKEVDEFLKESNAIEREYSQEALDDARTAWWYATTHYPDIESPQVIQQIHKRLMRRLRPDIAGKWRKCRVYIGGRVCKKPKRGEMLKYVYEWGKDAIRVVQITDTPAGAIRDLHVAFEYIHPFEDGNGRTGRIIMNIQRLQVGLPLLIIKEKAKYEYYKWFEPLPKVKLNLRITPEFEARINKQLKWHNEELNKQLDRFRERGQ